MSTPQLTQIRLKAFKSFKNEVLPIDPVTVLTGRNSSGKSNALDAIEVLSRLASGEDLVDALDGRRREGGPVRGGSSGCAPHGEKRFSLGCSVSVGRAIYRLDVVLEVHPELRIVKETLRGPGPAVESGQVRDRYLMDTRPASESGNMGLLGEMFNGKRGSNPIIGFRDSRLLTTQIPLRMDPASEAEAAVVRGAEAVTGALRGAFHLDPVPHLMRDYVPARDSDLRRTSENLSAALGRLRRQDEATFSRILQLTREVADDRIRDITITSSELGDVMLALKEQGPSRKLETTPAREMSDGLLRFIAVATALLTSNRGLDIDPGLTTTADAGAGVLVVIEELENGLHPSQATRVLALIRETTAELATRVVITTHSPALLNAMTGQLNHSVIVCFRDADTGRSHLTRMPQLPGYAEAIASGPLGDVISRGGLVRPETLQSDYGAFNRLLGLD